MSERVSRDSDSGFDVGFDADRLADALHVRYGPTGSGALRQAGYVLYVVALFGAFWGVAVTRATLLEVPLGLPMTAVGWLTIVLGFFVLAGSVVAIAHWMGRVRGPAVPSLPWIDLVATTSIDRALVLKESWHVALLLMIGMSSIGGLILGLSGAITGAWSARWIIACVGCFIVLGWLGARAALAGQTSAGTSSNRAVASWRSLSYQSALRAITVDRLREQSARSALVHGSVLVGDLRVAQLTLRSTRASARFARLRAAGPLRTIVRRDLLSYRRGVSRLISANAFALVGVSGICWALDRPSTSLVMVLAASLMYVGCGFLCEGLRLQSDTAGAPRLIGVAPRSQLLAHLVAPAMVLMAMTLPVALASALLLADSPTDAVAGAALACGWTLSLVTLCVASQAWGAFRASVPFGLVTSAAGPAITAFWYAVPPLVVSGTASLLTGQLARDVTWWPFAVAAFAALGTLWLAIGGLNETTDAHRL